MFASPIFLFLFLPLTLAAYLACPRRWRNGVLRGASAEPRARVYRDSMADALIPMLAENFSRIVFISGRRLAPALIEREYPDVVMTQHPPGSSDSRPLRSSFTSMTWAASAPVRPMFGTG